MLVYTDQWALKRCAVETFVPQDLCAHRLVFPSQSNRLMLCEEARVYMHAHQRRCWRCRCCERGDQTEIAMRRSSVVMPHFTCFVIQNNSVSTKAYMYASTCTLSGAYTRPRDAKQNSSFDAFLSCNSSVLCCIPLWANVSSQSCACNPQRYHFNFANSTLNRSAQWQEDTSSCMNAAPGFRSTSSHIFWQRTNECISGHDLLGRGLVCWANNHSQSQACSEFARVQNWSLFWSFFLQFEDQWQGQRRWVDQKIEVRSVFVV